MKMGFWKRLLDTLIDPNLIALMLSLGVLGIVIELWHPGLIFPATFGVLCLAIAFYGLDVLPISWAGVVLLAAAFAFWITELFIAFSHGALTVAGAVCFVFGCLLLFEPAGSSLSGLALGRARGGGDVLAVLRLRARQGRPDAPPAGERRHAHAPRRSTGWCAPTASSPSAASSGRRAREGGEPLEPGDEVDVVAIDGPPLVVRPAREPAAV